MAWSTKQTASLSDITETEVYFSPEIAESLGTVAHLQVDVTYPSSPVDSVLVSVYSTLDATSEKWDATPAQSFSVGPSEPTRSFLVQNFYKFRVGIKRLGSTDSISAVLAFRTAIQL